MVSLLATHLVRLDADNQRAAEVTQKQTTGTVLNGIKIVSEEQAKENAQFVRIVPLIAHVRPTSLALVISSLFSAVA
jgi:hypothetical protein